VDAQAETVKKHSSKFRHGYAVRKKDKQGKKKARWKPSASWWSPFVNTVQPAEWTSSPSKIEKRGKMWEGEGVLVGRHIFALITKRGRKVRGKGLSRAPAAHLFQRWVGRDESSTADPWRDVLNEGA